MQSDNINQLFKKNGILHGSMNRKILAIKEAFGIFRILNLEHFRPKRSNKKFRTYTNHPRSC